MATVIDELDSNLLGQLTESRSDLHSHPELGFQETRTAAAVITVTLLLILGVL